MNSLTYLALIITYQCSSECEHCCIGAGPENREWMSLETARLTQWFEGHGFGVESSPVVLHGRAVNLARHHTGPRSIPQERCAGVSFFATEDWRKPGGVEIDVLGSVMLEHGICIGNARERGLSEILEEYDAGSHPIINVLMREGPIGLTRIPQASGFVLRENGYVDECHLCQDIRTHLRPHSPDILWPENYYPPILDRGASNNPMQAMPNGAPDG